MLEKEDLELSVIMPCLEEENTVGACIEEARLFMERWNIEGEILVVDNGSLDASAAVAARHGARLLTELKRGYGNAIRTGIAGSRGKVLIIGDCDMTYDFLHLEAIYQPLAARKCDMVIGNRYAGEMERGSMPWLHWWGVRFLSFCGRKCFHTDVYDFHCGLRGISRKAAEQLVLCTQGMEFATEMIAKGAEKKLCIIQVPVRLRKCNYERKSKLRMVRDGLRHLIYMIKNMK